MRRISLLVLAMRGQQKNGKTLIVEVLGTLIPGTAGVRKVRWALPGGGKSDEVEKDDR